MLHSALHPASGSSLRAARFLTPAAVRPLRMLAAAACAVLISTAGPARAESSPAAAAEAPEPATPAPAAVLATPAPPVTAPMARRADRTYTFQVVLLEADNTTPGVVENVPARAQKALKDLQDFLPYKSYHLVDMAWLRTSLEASSLVTGPKGETYSVEILVGASNPDRILVQEFRISKMGQAPGSPPGVPRPLSRLLSSTFGMNVGETVVVGTAKLDNPGHALIVMLSALP